jgi:hypothetical protein
MKILIAGSRTLTPQLAELYQWLCESFNVGLGDKIGLQPNTEIVCGMAYGVDLAGRSMALKLGASIKEFPADWNKYKKAAGYIRNAEMAKYCDCALIVWDGQSKGTQHMMDLLTQEKKPYYLIKMGITKQMVKPRT